MYTWLSSTSEEHRQNGSFPNVYRTTFVAKMEVYPQGDWCDIIAYSIKDIKR